MTNIERDKLKFTKEVLTALRETVERMGEKALQDYLHIGGEGAMEAFELAISVLQMAVKESKKMAMSLRGQELLDLLKNIPSSKKSPYNQS